MYNLPLSQLQEAESESKTSGSLPVSSMDPGTQGMLHRLAMHFRGGMLASILRVEMGTVFAPPAPAARPRKPALRRQHTARAAKRTAIWAARGTLGTPPA